ncbi:hypothetical protein AAKU67_002812 [Oxalobacteraceae bacterium GrIS 2.11]
MSLMRTSKPYDDESGLGYYRRLAAENSLWGWHELTGIANLKRNRSTLLGCPEHLATDLGLELSWSQFASHTEQQCNGWGGLHRTSMDAICPACLNDEVYIRQYWEHAYVTACPIHRTSLVDRCPACNERLSSNRERIEQCQCGHDLRTCLTEPASPSQLWVSTLIASHGDSTGGIEPKMHHVDIKSLCDLIRILCLYADPMSPPPRRRAASPKSVSEAIEILAPLELMFANWPAGFENHVAHRIASGKKEARTLNTLLGSWYLQLKKCCQTNALKPFLRITIAVAARDFDGILGSGSEHDIVSDTADFVPIEEAAKSIGVGRDRLLKAANANECAYRTRRRGTRGVVYEILKTEVGRLVQKRAEWISKAQAYELAGVSESVMDLMVAAKIVLSDVQWKNDINKGGQINKKSLQDLTARIDRLVDKQHNSDGEHILWSELTSRRMGDKKAIHAVMRAAVAGEFSAVKRGHRLGEIGFLMADVAQYFGTPILEAGLSVQKLADATGWKWETISHWVGLGLLESTRIILRGQPCTVISPQQLLKFRQNYLPLADLANAMGTKSSALADKLSGIEVIGAKPLPNGRKRGGLIRIADLGLSAVIGCAQSNSQ